MKNLFYFRVAIYIWQRSKHLLIHWFDVRCRLSGLSNNSHNSFFVLFGFRLQGFDSLIFAEPIFHLERLHTGH